MCVGVAYHSPCSSSVCTVSLTTFAAPLRLERFGLKRASHGCSLFFLGIGAVLTDFLRLQQRQIRITATTIKMINSMAPKTIAMISPVNR